MCPHPARLRVIVFGGDSLVEPPKSISERWPVLLETDFAGHVDAVPWNPDNESVILGVLLPRRYLLNALLMIGLPFAMLAFLIILPHANSPDEMARGRSSKIFKQSSIHASTPWFSY
ncbi:hypothetical protein K503DRAFT_233027 [Rhizopogon vinicolor AM-OR11-026]|uniref:Uncharacterized protein n=1 Tax=Rhizopogon vinicolor AM-OR11-026 TaxID=1314800 RepID=A0A1B7NEA4_9AGAM|nr:hypothetical protein K503DRAFT_233027 [Rhizopogon vinicolor AM-OR11-026]